MTLSFSPLEFVQEKLPELPHWGMLMLQEKYHKKWQAARCRFRKHRGQETTTIKMWYLEGFIIKPCSPPWSGQREHNKVVNFIMVIYFHFPNYRPFSYHNRNKSPPVMKHQEFISTKTNLLLNWKRQILFFFYKTILIFFYNLFILICVIVLSFLILYFELFVKM